MQPAQIRPKKLSVDLGSYLGGSSGDRRVEAPGTWAQLGWVGERAGRNASEVWAPSRHSWVPSRRCW
jgi:hypothetical protein